MDAEYRGVVRSSHNGTIRRLLGTLVIASTAVAGIGGSADVASAQKKPKLSGSITVAEAALEKLVLD